MGESGANRTHVQVVFNPRRGKNCRKMTNPRGCYNRRMIISRHGLRAAALVAGLLLWGCAAQGQAPAPTPSLVPSRPGALTPYTPPPSPSRTPTSLASPTAAPVPSITPTPLTYVVKANDDLGLIAYRFGVTIAALQAANPNIDPRAMRIGTVLVIPASPRPAAPLGGATAPNSSPTPVPLLLSGPDCWPSGDGGLWCFLLARNDQPGPLENISVKVRVGGEGSQGSQAAILERSAYGLLDRLPPGKSLPLAVFFPAPLPGAARASAELLLSFPVAEGDGRYLDPTLEEVTVSIAPDGLSAALNGQIALASGKASVAWLAAAALEADGRVVAVRRWENPAALEAGKPQDFALDLFSLGGKIARVEYLAEARP